MIERWKYLVFIIVFLSACASSNIDTPTPAMTSSPPTSSTLVATITSIPHTAIPTLKPTAIPEILTSENLNQIVPLKKFNLEPSDIAWSPNSKFFAVATGEGIYVYDVLSFNLKWHTESESTYRVKFSPDGQFIVTDEEINRPTFRDINDGQIDMGKSERYICENYDGGLFDLQFHHTNKILATSNLIVVPGHGPYSVVKLIDSLTGECVYLTNGAGINWSLEFDPSGQLLGIGFDKRDYFKESEVQIWDVNLRQQICSVRGRHVAFQKSKPIFATADFELDGYESSGIYIWDQSDCGLLYAIEDIPPIWDLSFSPDGKLIVAGNNQDVILWDYENNNLETVPTIIKNYVILNIEFSPDGRFLLTNEILWGMISEQ